MRIVFLHRANDPYTLERIKYFINNGHKVFSVVFNDNIEINRIPNQNVIILKKNKLDNVLLFRRFIHFFEIKKILNEIKPDVFHIVNALNLFYFLIKTKSVKLIENQGSDLILTPLKHKYLIPYYKYFFKKVDGVIGDSKQLYENSLRYGASDNPKTNRIIEIGIDFNIFNKEVEKNVIRKKYNIDNRYLLLHTRGLSPLYNLDILLKAILIIRKQFKDILLILTTELDKLEKEYQDYIETNNLKENILFVGFQNRIEDLKFFYRDADLCISIPSSDSSPFSVYESMACYTTNIVTDLPWLYNKFQPNIHLLTCNIKDENDLANKVIGYLNGNLSIDKDSAYNIVYKEINLEIENKKLEELYNYLISKKYAK